MKTTMLPITLSLLVIITCLTAVRTYSQIDTSGFQNYGAYIKIEQGASISVVNDYSAGGGNYRNFDDGTPGRIDLDGWLIVEGNWTNNASNQVFESIETEPENPDGWVELRGNITQNIDGSSQTTFENLLVNNSSINGINVNTQINIVDTMLFYDGIVHTTENSVVEFRENATSTDGAGNAAKDESYVEGPVRKIGSTPFTFPTGGGLGCDLFRPISVSGFDGNMQTFTAWYRSNNPDYEGYDRSLTDNTIKNVSNCEYWTLDRSEGNVPTVVTLSWSNEYTCNIPQNYQRFRVARWNGSLWENKGNTGTNTYLWGGEVRSELNNDFSPFALAHEHIFIDVPNAITPNDDTHNDALIIKGLEICPENEMMIFNRWGNKVWEASPYDNDNPWYGQSRSHFMKVLGGETVPDGTYYFILKFEGDCSEIDPITGYIEVKRY